MTMSTSRTRQERVKLWEAALEEMGLEATAEDKMAIVGADVT